MRAPGPVDPAPFRRFPRERTWLLPALDAVQRAVALDQEAAVLDAVRILLSFNVRESCGKCTPCREGTARLLTLLDQPVDASRVKSLSEIIQVASLCGLGQAAPYSVLSAIDEFPDEFNHSARGSGAWA